MSRDRSFHGESLFLIALLGLTLGTAACALAAAEPRVTWTDRRPVTSPCDPAGPGWYRTYGQDTRGDGRCYQGASVALPDSVAAYQGALRRATSGLASGIRTRIQPVLYSCLEQWPRNPDRASNRALADSALSRLDRMAAGTASVWKSGDCPQSNEAGVIQHIAFVVVGTDLDELIDVTWSKIETGLVMPQVTDGKSDSEAFRQRVLEVLGVRAGGGLEAELERAAEAERATEEQRRTDEKRRKEIRQAEAARQAETARQAEEVRRAEKARIAEDARRERERRSASLPAAATPAWARDIFPSGPISEPRLTLGLTATYGWEKAYFPSTAAIYRNDAMFRFTCPITYAWNSGNRFRVRAELPIGLTIAPIKSGYGAKNVFGWALGHERLGLGADLNLLDEDLVNPILIVSATVLGGQSAPWHESYTASGSVGSALKDAKGLIPWKAPYRMKIFGISYDTIVQPGIRAYANMSFTSLSHFTMDIPEYAALSGMNWGYSLGLRQAAPRGSSRYAYGIQYKSVHTNQSYRYYEYTYQGWYGRQTVRALAAQAKRHDRTLFLTMEPSGDAKPWLISVGLGHGRGSSGENKLCLYLRLDLTRHTHS